jgi:hypothetical protein
MDLWDRDGCPDHLALVAVVEDKGNKGAEGDSGHCGLGAIETKERANPPAGFVTPGLNEPLNGLTAEDPATSRVSSA